MTTTSGSPRIMDVMSRSQRIIACFLADAPPAWARCPETGQPQTSPPSLTHFNALHITPDKLDNGRPILRDCNRCHRTPNGRPAADRGAPYSVVTYGFVRFELFRRHVARVMHQHPPRNTARERERHEEHKENDCKFILSHDIILSLPISLHLLVSLPRKTGWRRRVSRKGRSEMGGFCVFIVMKFYMVRFAEPHNV